MLQAKRDRVIIIGAGPAGLTAGAELAAAGYNVTILEKDPEYVGGIARTVRYGKFRFDIGGHRFFSKNPEITEWWRRRLPGEFLKVRRLSRILYRGRYFDYPLKPLNAFRNLGFWTSARCLASYAFAKISPVRPEVSFQDWVSNRFGRELFSIFFKTYTEKVWGIPCTQISVDWAAQRINNLSVARAIANSLRPKIFPSKEVIKTLIDNFEYPRLGPGMMWEKTRDDILAAGGRIEMGQNVVAINASGDKVSSVVSRNASGCEKTWDADFFIATCPLRETVLGFNPPLPLPAREAAERLRYRSFITIALMIGRTEVFPGQWIYVHSPEVKLGRIQNFNNWSPSMVPAGMTCLGLEYFCDEGDGFWNAPDGELIETAKEELEILGISKPGEVIDAAVVRMPKAYPVYMPNYAEAVKIIRRELEPFANFQVIGRNGMHKYNNQDHAMMTALFAARNIQGGKLDVWRVNADAEYMEEGNAGS